MVGHSTRLPRDVRVRDSRREASAVVRHSDVDDPQLPLHDVIQQRYERIRPLVLWQEQTASQRAQETDTRFSSFLFLTCHSGEW